MEFPLFFQRRINHDDFHFRHRASYGFMPVDRHLHEYYELVLVKKGHVEYNVEGHTYSLSDGDMILTNTKEIHCPFYMENEYIELYFITVRPLFVAFILAEEFNPFDIFDGRKLGHGNKIDAVYVKSRGIDKLFEDIEAELMTNLPRNKLVVMGKFTELLCKVAEIMQETTSEYRTNRKVHDIVKYINEHLSEDLQAEDLGRRFFLEKNYLRRLFKKETGYAVSDYVQQKRIIKAQEMLGEGENANEVARKVGYNEYTTFYRAFKRVTGVVPGEYKQKNNKNRGMKRED